MCAFFFVFVFLRVFSIFLLQCFLTFRKLQITEGCYIIDKDAYRFGFVWYAHCTNRQIFAQISV